MEILDISLATKRNWARLGVSDFVKSGKLKKRANKQYSQKNIIPYELIDKKNHIDIIQNIVNVAERKRSSIHSIVYSVALNLLLQEGLLCLRENNWYSCNSNVENILKEFRQNLVQEIFLLNIPNEASILDAVYQILLTEGEKNKKGVYYTPREVILELNELVDNDNIKFLDPACGTGNFLLSVADKIKNPENLFGIDIDPIACFITKIKLVIKFKSQKFVPQVYNFDFLNDERLFQSYPLEEHKFDIIATNPPWGAQLSYIPESIRYFVRSGESFSCFIIQANKYLAKDGICSFLLPVSMLNVALHKDVRKFILDNFNINKIAFLGKLFTGVLTDVVMLNLSRKKGNNLVELSGKGIKGSISQHVFESNLNYNFTKTNAEDVEILNKMYAIPHLTLEKSIWGLGIVTGNNEKYILENPKEDFEEIYTGKEITPYFLLPAKKYIKYKREHFQQVAPDNIYRAKEKLLYKFISSKLTFAYDDSKSLVLNSANILIPVLEGYTIKETLAFLNSSLFQFIYRKKFDEVKILKGNLLQLPFPIISEGQRRNLDGLTQEFFCTKSKNVMKKIDELVFSVFNLTKKEQEYLSKGLL